jgi:2-oxoglutarate ferredoxin oxidoreductase subunit alpha
VPPIDRIPIINRVKPQSLGIKPEDYLLSGHSEVPPMPSWGEGYSVNYVGLVRHEDGHITKYNPDMHLKCVNRIRRKIEDNVDSISQVEEHFLKGCRYLVICYGSVSRTGIEAVIEARKTYNIPIGFIRLKTLWPFPENQLRSLVPDLDKIFVPEMNLGMMIHPIKEALGDRCDHFISIPSLGILHSPEMILSNIYKEIKL